MLELVAELSAASTLLNTAIDQYLNACTAIQTYYTQTSALAGVPSTLASSIANESISIPSYTTKLSRACSIINQARNISTTLAPIHALPSEVLARIFLLVVGPSCGIDVDDGKSRSVPKYPDFLSHVCSRWRHTSIELPALWTHIDLAYFHSSGERFIDRAEVFATRSNPLPLDVHIRIPRSWDSDNHAVDSLLRFLNSIAERTKGLELATPATVTFFQAILFDACNAMQPGVLLEFSIIDHAAYTPKHIYPFDWEEEPQDFEPESDMDELHVYMRQQQLEDILLPVRVLRLCGLYLDWKSRAYHGLVELHLDRPVGSWGHHISALQLYGILTSSPKLAVLHFGLELNNRDGFSYMSVDLQELQVLNLRSLCGIVQLETFFLLFAPCSRPLHLTMWLEGNGVGLLSHSGSFIAQFLQRSNVEKLCLGGYDCHKVLAVPDLLGLFPSLRILLLHGAKNLPPEARAKIIENSSPATPFSLEGIYLQHGEFELDYLCHLIARCSVQALVLKGSVVYSGTKQLTRDELSEKLSQFSPIVKYLDFDSRLENQTADWSGWLSESILPI